jgi:hypothetical protein
MEISEQRSVSQNKITEFRDFLRYDANELNKISDEGVKRFMVSEMEKLRNRISDFLRETDTW